MMGTMMWVLIFLFIVLQGQDHTALGWMDWGQTDEPEKVWFTRKKNFWSITTPGSARHTQIACGYAANSLRTI